MPDASVKMGVTGIAQFKSGMNQAQQSVKTLDAALKLNEKQLQATGDKETYMQQKSKLLQQQIAAQNIVIKQGQQALAAMEKNGVNPASQAYQKMQQQVLNAQTALLGMNDDLNTVGESAQETAQKTDQLASSLNGINKKVNFDAVLNGVGKITDGMEAAGHKIEAIARDVWDTMATAAAWADNENTLAAMYGIDVETLQRMQGASRTIDTSVEAIIKSRQKLKQNMASDSQDVADIFTLLGVDTGFATGKFNEIRAFRDWEDVFWDAGDALLHYGDEITRDVMAQQLFGRSWMELMPLFQAGREEYQKTMGDQTIVTEENVDRLNALDDALQKLDQDYQATKNTILSELAPAFTMVADGLSNMIRQVNEYLQTEEGKEKLEALGQAVTDLFAGLTDVDFGQAIETAGGILDSITGALDWIMANHTAVETALKGIGGAFLALKAAEVVGTLVQSAAALKTLLGGGGAAATGAGAAGTAAKIGLGALLKKAGGGLLKLAPWAAGAYVALKPAPTADDQWDSLYDKNGKVTEAGKAAGLPATRAEYDAWTQEDITAYNQQQSQLRDEASQQARLTALQKYLWRKMGADYTWYSDDDIRREIAKDFDTAQAGMVDALLGEIDQMAAGGQDIHPDAIDEAALLQKFGLWPGNVERAVESIYDDLYKAINDYDPDTSTQDTTQFFNNVLYPLIQEAGKASGVVGDNIDAIADLIYDKWIQSMYDDEWEGTTGGLLNILQEAIDENADGLKVETEPVLPEDAASSLQQQLDGVTLSVSVIPDLASIDGSHANGLPFVPFDGYIAALHKGERIVPAAQNRTMTNNSNLYVEHMHMNNGTDVNGLASAIAERTRHTMAGLGS